MVYHKNIPYLAVAMLEILKAMRTISAIFVRQKLNEMYTSQEDFVAWRQNKY
jgi:hypothetical protein